MRFTHTRFFRAWKIYAPLARHRCIATQYFISHVLPWLKKDFMYTAPNPKPPMKSFLLKDSRATSDSLKSSFRQAVKRNDGRIWNLILAFNGSSTRTSAPAPPLRKSRWFVQMLSCQGKKMFFFQFPNVSIAAIMFTEIFSFRPDSEIPPVKIFRIHQWTGRLSLSSF